MRTVFADTGYWVALLNQRDGLHARAVRASEALGGVPLLTTDSVLLELLNYFAGLGSAMRETAAQQVRELLEDPEVEVLPQDRATFLAGLEFYDRRRDKGYSLVDCISMLAMRERKVAEGLTPDHHFEQEGFTILL